ncbi:MAG TPA: hypothetical protein VLF91_05095 [Candidatus Saccharimonadales bacterium]|nr:hypothetical protein [Candidatus Saccharimonadales bacterium]
MSQTDPSNPSRIFSVNIHPLTYDALSGEFAPPSDPQARAHTLGRLLYAAFHKGWSTDPPWTNAPVARGERAYVYEPSWAPGVMATALCVDLDRGSRIWLHGLHLQCGHDTLAVFDDTAFAPSSGRTAPKIQWETDNGDGHEYDLELGESGLIVAQDSIAVQAQRFFDCVPY